MVILDFDTEKLFTYRWGGKFQSPSSEWIHMTRRLNDYELMFVTEGTLYIASGGVKYTISKGQYILMRPTDSQYGYKASDCSFYWLHIAYNNNTNDHEIYDIKDSTETYRRGHLLIPETGDLVSPDRIIILMKQLQDSDKRYREMSLNNYLASAVLAELANQSYLFKKYGESNNKKQLYNDICDYLNLRVSTNVKMDELAGYFGYNKKYLTTFFRMQSGITVKKYILQTKMEHAKAELTDTNHSIAQIAYSIGFDDVHNFSNAFKKMLGLSPSNYRNSFNKRFLNHN